MVTRQAAGVLRPAALSATEGEPQLSPIPTSVREALADPNWLRAMEEEYEALLANQTWDWQIRTGVVRWKRSMELFLPTRFGILCHVRLVAMW
jgi:hypothetical protein